jgi:hypothetical protein
LAHRLFGWTDRWTAEEQHQDTSGTAAHKTISYKTLLPAVFPLQPQVVEKDTVMVPAGWDSWGKIKILRESFDCESINLQSAGCLQSFLGTLPPQPAFTKRTTMVVNNNDNVHLEIRLEDEQQFLSQQAAVLAASEEEAKTDDVAVRLKRLSKLKVINIALR